MPPERTCIACRRKGEQGSFLRVSRDVGGRVVVWMAKCTGRSAYFCRAEACIEAGLAKGRLDRALRGSVAEVERARLKEDLICKLR